MFVIDKTSADNNSDFSPYHFIIYVHPHKMNAKCQIENLTEVQEEIVQL